MMGMIQGIVTNFLVILTATILVNESVKTPKNEKEFKNAEEKAYSADSKGVTLKETLPCEEYADCNYQKRVCNCDQSCELFDDCCNVNYMNLSRSDRQQFIVSHYKRCISIQNRGIWIIDKCPENMSFAITKTSTSMTSQTRKTQLAQILPVTDKFNITYRNAEIAECHGAEDFLRWRMAVSDTQICSKGNSGTVLAKSLSDMMLNKSITPFSLAEALFENSCTFNYFPPDGRSSHKCLGKIQSSQNCSPLFHPIINEYIDSPIFQNLDCCKSLKKCETNYQCIVRPFDHRNPFDDGRGDNLKSQSSMILLDMNKKSHIQYFNIKYDRKFTFKVSALIEVEHLLSVCCLLMQYFEGNEFKIEQTKLLNYKEQNISYASTWFRLNSRRLLIGFDSVREIEGWLDSMEIEIELVSKTSDIIFMEDRNVNPDNVSVIHKVSARKQGVSFIYKSSHPRGLCRYLEKENTSPRSWCRYLYVKAITDGETFNVQWTCKVLMNQGVEKKHNFAKSSLKVSYQNELTIYGYFLSYFLVFLFL